MSVPERTLHLVHGEPSWRLATDAVEAFVTEAGGHLGPVAFRLGDRTVSPYHVAPWAEERLTDLPPIVRVLRGDFFCLPFGGNAAPFGIERHPPHGETANGAWTFEGMERQGDTTTLRLALDLSVRAGRVTKEVTLVDGHAALYQRHTVEGVEGPMSFGHHAMLRFPDRAGSGLVATAPFVWGGTAPLPVEDPATRGYSLFQLDAPFDSLDAIPTVTGATADLSSYPTPRGYEDLVMVATAPDLALGWTAVTFPDEGFVWFSLKDPRVLRQTILWVSNGGRHYPPWSGRHASVLGLEDVTSYFHYGLAESVANNPLSERSIPTTVDFDGTPFVVPSIHAVAAVPEGFDHVATVEAHEGDDAVTLRSRSEATVTVPVRHRFLREG